MRNSARVVVALLVMAASLAYPSVGAASPQYIDGPAADLDFDSLSAAGNNDPGDLWSDGTTMFVSDTVDGKIYAYSMDTRLRDADKDLALHADNAKPVGIWSDGTTMWVVDSEDRKVYAYLLADGTRDVTKEFDLRYVASPADDDVGARNHQPLGAWSDGTNLWVLNGIDGDRRLRDAGLFIYRLSDGSFDSFNGDYAYVNDVWSARSHTDTSSSTVWGTTYLGQVSWNGPNLNNLLESRDIDSHEWDPDKEFRLSGAENLIAVWSDGTTFYGLSDSHDKIHSGHAPTPPRVPEDLSATVAGSGSVMLGWSATPDDGTGTSDLVSYEVRYRQHDAGWVEVKRAVRLALDETFTGLTNYVEHTFEVRATNSELKSDWAAVSQTPAEPVLLGAPSVPQSVSATSLIGGFTLTWSAPATEGTSSVTGYEVRYRLADTRIRGDWVDVAVSGLATTATLTDPVTLAPYDLQVRAVNSVGGGAWATVTQGGISQDDIRGWPIRGIWGNDSTMWLAGTSDIRAFDLASGERKAADEFSAAEIGDDIESISAIWSDGDTMWVADASLHPKVLAYSMSTKQRTSSDDFGHLLPSAYTTVISDMWSDGETLWVLDRIKNNAYAFDVQTKARAVHHEFHVGAKRVAGTNFDWHNPEGIWSDGETFWIAWDNEEIDAFDAVTKRRLSQFDSRVTAGTSFPGSWGRRSALWADDDSAWIMTGGDIVALELKRRPGLPADVTVVSGDAQATLSWSVPDAGSAPTGYAVGYRLDTTSAWTAVSRSDAALISETIEGLANGELYYIGVQSQRGGLASSWVEALASPAPTGTPGAPEDLVVSGDLETGPEGGQDRALSIAWAAPAGATSVTYEVQYHRDGSSRPWTTVTANAALAARLTRLDAGQRYAVRVRAMNSTGSGPWAVESNRAGRGFYNLQRFRQRIGCTRCYESFGGLWSDGQTLWLTANDRWPPSSLRAYDLASKERMYDKDVVSLPLDEPRGLTGDSGDFVVVNGGTILFDAQDTIFEVGRVSKTADTRFATAAANSDPQGVWSDGSTIWVSDGNDVRIYAYSAADGSRQPENDFGTLLGGTPGHRVVTQVIYHDGRVVLHQLDSDGNLSTITVSSVESQRRPSGLWSDGTTMWVADRAWDRIYAYDVTTKERDLLRDLGPFDSSVEIVDIWGDVDSGDMFILDGGTRVFTAALPVPPDAPSGVATDSSDGSAMVRWDAVTESGGSPLIGYEVWYRPRSDSGGGDAVQPRQTGRGAGSGGGWTKLPLVDPEVTEVEVSNLTNGEVYDLSTRAVNYETTSDWERSDAEPLGAPSAPRSLSVSAVGSEVLAVSWVAPSDSGGHAISQYEAEYVLGSSPDWSSQDVEREVVTGLSTSLSGLTNGSVYSVRVRASVSTGDGEWASGSGTPLALPGAPSIGSVSDGDTELVVVWTAPTAVGGSAVIDYQVRYRAKAGPDEPEADWEVDSSSVTGSPWTIDRLVNGVLYEVGVRARNSLGRGEWSASSSVSEGVPSTVPDAPSDLSVFGGDTELTVDWSEPADTGGLDVDSYEVGYREAGQQAWVIDAAAITDETWTVGSLTNGSAYEVCVMARNATGQGPCAQGSATPARAPSRPGSLFVEHGAGSLELAWSTAGDGGDALDSYRVQYRTRDPVGAWRTASSTVAAAATQYTVESLQNGTEYDVEVQAHNSNGYGPPAEAYGTPSTVPEAPLEVRATPGDGSLAVSWSAGADGGAAVMSYEVQYREDVPGASFTVAGTVDPAAGESLSLTVSQLDDGTAYEVCVKARNANGDSECDSVTATPARLPAVPVSVVARPGDRSAVVSWDAPDDDGGAAVTSYQVSYGASDGTGTERTVTVRVSPDDTGAYQTVLSGLVNARAYAVSVAAENSRGLGVAERVSVTPLGRPGAVRDLESLPGDGEVTVTWQLPDNSSAAQVNGYEVEYRQKTTPQAAWTQLPRTGPDVAALSAVIDELAPGQDYEIRVRATNATSLVGLWASIDAAPVPASGLTVGRSSAHENDEAGLLAFTLQLDQAARRTVSVSYETRDGTGDSAATEGVDYTAVSGQAVILNGQNQTSISVEILGDTLVEDDETFSVTLSNLSGAEFPGDADQVTVTGTIIDDDAVVVRVTTSGGGGSSGDGSSGGGGSSGAGAGGSGGGGGSADFDVGVATFVVANGWSAPDVGVASVLAARISDAVVVYTAGGVLSEETRELMREASPAEVIIVGGIAAVSRDVRTQMAAASPDSDVARVTGADRVATAAAAARRILGDASSAGRVTLIVANGWSPPDIGAAAALAASSGRAAVVYVEAGRLPDATAALLGDYEVARVIVVGGTAAVSAEVHDAIGAAAGGASGASGAGGVSISRLTGADRVDTAALAARRVLGNAAAAPDGVTLVVANGWSPPDVGVAAALAAVTDNAAVLYTAGGVLSQGTAALIGEYRVGQVIIIGGRAAVSDEVRTAIADAVPEGATIRRVTGTTRTHTAANAARRILAGR